MKKHFLFLSLIVINLSFSQKIDCKYEFTEKTDSTSIKTLPEILVHEKIFGNTNEFIQFALINYNGVPTLNFQYLQKSKDFISASCLNKSSKIIFQLENGKFVTLICQNDDVCNTLSYDEKEKNNIRILNAYFYFLNSNYEDLKSSPISLMRVQFSNESKDFVIKKEIKSELFAKTSYPKNIFINYLKCIE